MGVLLYCYSAVLNLIFLFIKENMVQFKIKFFIDVESLRVNL